MSEPSMREVHRALRTPGRHVIVVHPDGFEVASEPGLRAAFADPDRSVAILSGPGWDDFAHLMDPELRQTEPAVIEPDDEVEPTGRRPALREFERRWDPTAGEYVWVEITRERGR